MWSAETSTIQTEAKKIPIIIKNGKHYRVSESIVESQQKRLFTDDIENECEERRMK